MTLTRHDETILIQDDGRTVASAEVHLTRERGLVHSDLHVASGQVPGGTGTRLVDAVLAHPQVGAAERLVATMPLGDTEMLARVRQRCTAVETRAAGATKLVEVRLAHLR